MKCSLTFFGKSNFRNQRLSEGALIWRDAGPVATETPQKHAAATFWPFPPCRAGLRQGTPARMQHAVVQKRLSVLRPFGRHAAPPPGGDADGQLGFWEFGGDTGRLVLPRVYRHSRHLQPRGTRAASGTGCTCPSCPLMCAAATGQQDVFLFTAWSHDKHVEILYML